jgi:hypothetical protein
MTITHSREAAVVSYAPSAVDSKAPNETETGVLGVSVEVGLSSQSCAETSWIYVGDGTGPQTNTQQ